MNQNIDLKNHKLFMSRAIELAKKGRGKVSPNPLVGCVIVKNRKIIGEGYHKYFGGPHAEVIALNNTKTDPTGSIAYVNLEPCCFTGKTPPCTNVFKENGISEVYIGMLDSNPKVKGRGIKELEKNNIITHLGIKQKEAMQLNQAFSKWITEQLPYVIAKVAQTHDGYMGVNSETSVWITGNKSKKHSHTLRSEVDAILIGRQTALIDNPSLTVREVSGTNPQRLVLDTNKKLPSYIKIFNDKKAETIVLCSENNFNNIKNKSYKYLPVKEKNGFLSPLDILKTIAKEGITSILIEGGRATLLSFINKNLINKIYIYTSPTTLDNPKLVNPIKISNKWSVIKKDKLGEDSLIIAEKV